VDRVYSMEVSRSRLSGGPYQEAPIRRMVTMLGNKHDLTNLHSGENVWVPRLAMPRPGLTVALAALLLVAASASVGFWGASRAFCQSVDSGEEEPPRPGLWGRPIGGRPITPGPPERIHRNEVTRLIDRAVVGRPYHHRGLTVFPIELRGEVDRHEYVTLDEAFRKGWVQVFETGTVAQLAVENSSAHHVFAMGGEVLAGGKQNRLLREDVLLPPRSGRIIVPVYCGEKGRWTDHAGKGFASTGKVVPQRLRAAALSRRPQEEIWAGIREKAEEAGVSSSTEDFVEIARHEKVAGRLTEYRGAVKSVWRPVHCGMVVAVHGRIVGADVFCNRSLFSKLRGKLIDAYSLDCIGKPTRGRLILPPQPTREDAERYLRAVYRAQMVYEPTPGAGRAIAIRGAATGRALAHRENAIHLSLFQPRALRPKPPVRPPPPIEPLRRRSGERGSPPEE
jgi:hypothetical protein